VPVSAVTVRIPETAITPVKAVTAPVKADATLRKFPMNRQFWTLMLAPVTTIFAVVAVV
jgi:hypothetical protein